MKKSKKRSMTVDEFLKEVKEYQKKQNHDRFAFLSEHYSELLNKSVTFFILATLWAIKNKLINSKTL